MNHQRKKRLEAAHEALIADKELERCSRKLPDGYATVGDLLSALEERTHQHPSGVEGVARELGSPRRSIQRWLSGNKSPEEKSMAKIAEVLAQPLPRVS